MTEDTCHRDRTMDFEEGECLVWDDLSYGDRLEVTAFIFNKITGGVPGSFRRLIYNRLGFRGDAYEMLYRAGGMEITNAMHEAYRGPDADN